MDEKIKAILVIIVFILVIYILQESEKRNINNNVYETKISKYEYSICGTNISIDDYLYNNELNLNELLNSIKEICN